MQPLIDLVAEYGLVLVFLNVLLVQAGAPLPASPMLVVAGAVAATGRLPYPQLLISAVVASLIADLFWYQAGAKFGGKILKTLCRISLSPDSCVRGAENAYVRFGLPSLLVAKFIPGFNLVAAPMAGAMRAKRPLFVLFAAGGAALWAGLLLLLGVVFHDAIEQLLLLLSDLGAWALAVIGAAIALFVAFKWWQRKRFLKTLRMAMISVDELYRLMHAGADPLILDVRSPLAWAEQPPIAGAVLVDIADADGALAGVSRDREVVVYCACPNEASAARVAKMLMQRGFRHVRPLRGGYDAWIRRESGVGNDCGALSSVSSTNRRQKMVKVALFVHMEAKPGKEAEVEKFLRGGLPLVQQEPGTTTWYGLKLGPSTYGIFDTFADDAGRQAHLSGKVAAALMAQAPELFAKPPSIEKIEVLAAKLPK